MGQILKANYPLEYVAFLNVKVRTQEGLAYMFMAVDSYSGYLFSLEIERDENPETVLKNIYLLTEHKEFSDKNKKGFTLVFEDNENLAPQIETIIKSLNGKVMFNKTYNNFISNPVLYSLLQFMK